VSQTKHKIAIGITGASGSIYAKVLLDKLTQLKNQINEVSLVFSDNAKAVWSLELGNEDYKNYTFKTYDKNRDRRHHQVYIISKDEDFGEKIGKIATLEVLKQ
jgi:3-polyprenyl-4-hydroxybenzoate decarboxylase